MKPPKRIVSLVPSDTYTLLALGAGERLVGRTKYCVEPSDLVGAIPEVGGTKDPDIERILELQPDVVVMNEEENTKAVHDKLVKAGARVLATLPKTMTDGLAQVGRLGTLLGDLEPAAKERVRRAYRVVLGADATKKRPPIARVFVPIWMDPLMTMNDQTFLADALRSAGGENVFGDRERRFPLAADLGRAAELPRERTDGKDTRYPRVTLDEVRERGPDAILLTDEPHPFSEADAEVFRALAIPPLSRENIRFCSGRALMWPGLMSIEGHEQLRALLEDVARVASRSA